MKKIELKVEKIMCQGCENRIKNSLNMLEEVEYVEADHTTGIVKISYHNDIDVSKIKELINNLGFELVD